MAKVYFVFSVIAGCRRTGQVRAQLVHLGAQGLAGDAQQDGGTVLVPPGVLQDLGEQQPVQVAVGLCV